MATLQYCKSCGKDDHKRRSSSKCLNTTRKTKTPSEEFHQVDNYSATKIGLRSILKNNTIEPIVIDWVHKATRICYESTMFMNCYLLSCLESENICPNVDRNFIRQCMAVCCSTSRAIDPILQDSFSRFKDLQQHHNFELINATGMAQVITILAKEYLVNYENYLQLQKHRLIKFHWNSYCQRKGIKKEINLMFQELVTLSEDDNYDPNDYDDFYNPWIALLKEKSSVDLIYRLNKRSVLFGVKRSSLIPLYSTDAKYITIDTDALASLLKIPVPEFRGNKEKHWFSNFKFSNTIRKCFDFQIKTDGVGCSLVLKKELLIPKEKNKESSGDQWKKEKEEMEYQLLQDKEILIGIDPGRKDIATCVRKNLKTRKEDEFSLSNGQYYNDSKMKERLKKMRHHLREAGLNKWVLTLPSYKCSSLPELENAIKKTFVPQLEDLIIMKNQRKTKHLRWRCYIHKFKTLDVFCKKLLEGVQDKSKVAVLFGDASFNNSSRGYSASPRPLWLKKRLQQNHGITCIDTWEFNTSQICSHCHSPEKLHSCKTSHNSHYIRRCQSCRMIWNRDINAARNMVFLGELKKRKSERPVYFRKKVEKMESPLRKRCSIQTLDLAMWLTAVVQCRAAMFN